jgi:glycosyltransferase involved in cell wall biosynthesis
MITFADRSACTSMSSGADNGSGRLLTPPRQDRGSMCPYSARQLKGLLVISNLEYGGAQRQVVDLANSLNASGIEAHVCSLSDYVPLASGLWNASSRLHVLNKRGTFDFTVVYRLAELIGRIHADVVHAFLLDAEIAARLAGRLFSNVAVIGSERNTDYRRKWQHSVALRLTRRCVDAIIANSNAGKRFQVRTLGIWPQKIFVVHNGVDTTRFRPGSASHLRKELGIPDQAPVIALFSSFKRQKNHAMFFRMAKRVRDRVPQARFLCVGDELHNGLQGSAEYRGEMLALMESLGLRDVVRCLGNRDDVVDLYNLCDVTVLTSSREGTPNVLLESMACGVPVVATNVADNALVVPDGRAGYVIPFDDDIAMSRRVQDLLTDPDARRRMGARARDWVVQEFSTGALAKKTVNVYQAVLSRKNRMLCS